jgi:hypothetical protein
VKISPFTCGLGLVALTYFLVLSALILQQVQVQDTRSAAALSTATCLIAVMASASFISAGQIFVLMPSRRKAASVGPTPGHV